MIWFERKTTVVNSYEEYQIIEMVKDPTHQSSIWGKQHGLLKLYHSLLEDSTVTKHVLTIILDQ